jgi:hypothetical protein
MDDSQFASVPLILREKTWRKQLDPSTPGFAYGNQLMTSDFLAEK